MFDISDPRIELEALTDYNVRSRFLKLPIQNMLKVLEIAPIKPQIALINAINSPDYRFVVAALSRRTGKTLAANVIAFTKLLEPGSSVAIVSPNYSLSSISWNEQQRLVKQFKLEIVKNNQKDKELILANDSRLRMGSVSQVDSLVGVSYDLVLFDEAALDDNGGTAFQVALRPTLDKPNSKAIFISTPRMDNFFKEFFDRGYSTEYPKWCSIHSSYHENPRMTEEDVAEARATMSRAEFEQEYCASFVTMEGQIFNFNDDLIEDIDYFPVQDTIAGLDVGFKDPCAMAVILTDGNIFYIVDEYQENHTSTATQATNIKEYVSLYNIDFIYIDSAAAQMKYDFAYLYDLPTIGARKDINLGISYIQSLIDTGRLKVHPRCVRIIEALRNFRWDNRPGLIHERPFRDPKYIHLMDALRYALYSHSHNLNETLIR